MNVRFLFSNLGLAASLCFAIGCGGDSQSAAGDFHAAVDDICRHFSSCSQNIETSECVDALEEQIGASDSEINASAESEPECFDLLFDLTDCFANVPCPDLVNGDLSACDLAIDALDMCD